MLNRAMNRPLPTSAAVEATPSAPVTRRPLLELTLFCAWSTRLLIWSAVMCSGLFASMSRRSSRPWVDCCCRPGKPGRHLLPDEADEARDHEQDDQDGQDRRERGPQAEAPDADLLQRLDQRHDEQSDEDGHHEDLELREQQEQQVDAAGHGDDPPGPRGCGAQAQGHELTVTRALLRRHGLHDEGSSWRRSGGEETWTVRSSDPTASPGRSHGDRVRRSGDTARTRVRFALVSTSGRGRPSGRSPQARSPPFRTGGVHRRAAEIPRRNHGPGPPHPTRRAVRPGDPAAARHPRRGPPRLARRRDRRRPGPRRRPGRRPRSRSSGRPRGSSAAATGSVPTR